MTDAPTPRDVMATDMMECGFAEIDAYASADSILAALSAAGFMVVQRQLLTELTDEVEAYVTQEFDHTEGYPSMQLKKTAAMESVIQARALIQLFER